MFRGVDISTAIPTIRGVKITERIKQPKKPMRQFRPPYPTTRHNAT